MPCVKCSNGKWRLGSGKCMYKTLANCKKAEQAYYADRDDDDDDKSKETKEETVQKKKA